MLHAEALQETDPPPAFAGRVFGLARGSEQCPGPSGGLCETPLRLEQVDLLKPDLEGVGIDRSGRFKRFPRFAVGLPFKLDLGNLEVEGDVVRIGLGESAIQFERPRELAGSCQIVCKALQVP